MVINELDIKIHHLSGTSHPSEQTGIYPTKNVYVQEKTRYKSKIAILDNAYLKVQTLCYFMLKSDSLNGNKITSV